MVRINEPTEKKTVSDVGELGLTAFEPRLFLASLTEISAFNPSLAPVASKSRLAGRYVRRLHKVTV